MPNSAADIGANFSNYQGNAGLADVGLGVFNIDTKPLQQLAQYTFFYNKSKWEQKQKETDAKVAQLADLSNISLNDLRGKDKEQATKEFSDLLGYASEYARKSPKTEQEKIQNELEWQTKYGAFKNNFGSGKGRAVSYYAHLNTIKQNITDATTQDEAIRQLNKQFDDTDISTPISAVPNFKVEKFDIPKAVQQEFTSIAIMGNDNLKMKNGIYNPRINGGIADASLFAIGKAYPKKGTPEYDKLSQNEKDQADLQGTVPSDGRGLVDATGFLKKAMEPYIKDGVFHADSFENDNLSNTVLMKPYNALKVFNEKMHNSYNQALNGYFDSKGIKIPLPTNIVPDDFKYGFVDFTNITPNNVMQSGMYAEYTGDTFNPELQHTGEANDLTKARLIQSGENYRKSLDIAKDEYVANLPYEKQKAGAVGADGKPIDFGNLIYGINTPAKKVIDILKSDGTKVPNLKINNGVFLDSKGNVFDYSGDIKIPATNIDNSIITEFNKYSGTTKLAADGTVLSTPSTSKLVADNGFFTLRMENGEIKGIQADDGTFASANQFQHITLEAGQKGVTKFKKPDVNYGKQDQNGSTQSKLTDAQKFLQGIK